MALVPKGDPNGGACKDGAVMNLPWSEMFRSASLRLPKQEEEEATPPPPTKKPQGKGKAADEDIGGLSLEPDARLALYIAMAHAGLATALLVLYGLYRLLADFLRPLQWALLCSIPLRETQRALVAFWEPPLRGGLGAAVLALPLAAPSSFLSRAASSRIAGRTPSSRCLFLTGGILRHLKTLVAIGLMLGMILGFLSGSVFFSYKIGLEGKDAVMSLKSHVENGNYSEKIGLKKWLDDNDIPGLVDQYSAKLYDTVWEQIDQLAVQYNLTDFTSGFRHFLISQSVDPSGAKGKELITSGPHPYSMKLQVIAKHMKNREWMDIYRELDSFFRELLITREDLVVKAKGLALQGAEIAKSLLSSSTSVLGGSANLMLSIALHIVSGAAEVLNFVSQLMVFLWVLYYLITVEGGGATEQVIDLLPLSKQVKDRCVEVIDHAISSVLLATAKIAIFQGCLTWLLFKFFKVHFVYTSTVFAIISALLPILPPWLSSIFAAGQLLMEGRYVLAIVVTVVHLIIMDYGTTVIQEDIPGYNGYLTGLSIIGGMALFPNALEGAILGPLIMTVVMALKNLYTEFVLVDSEETSS
uniref:Transmembrane protein 245 n=1 Tax=Oryza punctata TaxID=4537 RepID=A0A0E0LAN5_ORYPU